MFGVVFDEIVPLDFELPDFLEETFSLLVRRHVLDVFPYFEVLVVI